jgi:hypothetical protein
VKHSAARLLALSIVSFAALPPAASATITTTQITAPASGLTATYNDDLAAGSAANSATFAGTTDSDAVATDKVRVACVTGTYSGGRFDAADLTKADGSGADLALASDGTFSATLSLANAADRHGPCTFVAHPAGAAFADSDINVRLKGPKGFVDWWDPTFVSAPVHDGTATPPSINTDYYVGHPGALGGEEWEAADACGPYYMNTWLNTLLAPPQVQLWDCAAWLGSDDGTGSRGTIEVDGRDAYLVNQLPKFDYPGPPAVQELPSGALPISTPSYAREATGEITVNESEIVQRCNGDAYPATATSCASLVDTGLRFNRTLHTADGGRSVSLTDTWVNTTATDQALDVEYKNFLTAWQVPTLKFPGDETFVAYGNGDAKTLPARSTGTILARDSDNPDSIRQNAGYLTYGTQPDDVHWTDGFNTFVLHYVRTVPANGSLTLRHAVGTARTTEVAGALGRLQEDTFEAPTVSIDAPANGAVLKSSKLIVRGKSADNVGVSALTVNGQPVSLGGDGTFSAPVTLRPGANTVTAVATDAAGNASQASVAVTYMPPAPPKCRVPKVKRGSKLATVKKRIVKAHCRVGKVKKARSKHVRRGRVIRVSPKGTHRFQTKVTVIISSGKRGARSSSRRTRTVRSGDVTRWG